MCTFLFYWFYWCRIAISCVFLSILNLTGLEISTYHPLYDWFSRKILIIFSFHGMTCFPLLLWLKVFLGIVVFCDICDVFWLVRYLPRHFYCLSREIRCYFLCLSLSITWYFSLVALNILSLFCIFSDFLLCIRRIFFSGPNYLVNCKLFVHL